MTKVVILQSSYIPWKGYFDLVNDADIFVFLDDVQYTSRDWRSRNKIKTKDGAQWLSVPVGNNRDKLINEVSINDGNWQVKHLKRIVSSYSKSAYFDELASIINDIYIEHEWDNLSKMNQYIVKKLANALSISTTFIDSSALDSAGKNQFKLLEIAKLMNADEYISGPSAKSYLSEDLFKDEKIKVTWKEYDNYPLYNQLYPPYEPHVSILDLIASVGIKAAPYYIWGWRSEKDTINQ